MYVTINATNYATVNATNYATVNVTNYTTVNATNYATINATNYANESRFIVFTVPDSNVGWPNVGPTSALSSRRWPNVSPVYIAVWDVVWYQWNLPIPFMILSLAVRWSYDCPVTIKESRRIWVNKSHGSTKNWWFNHNKAKHYTTFCIFMGLTESSFRQCFTTATPNLHVPCYQVIYSPVFLGF